MQLFCGKNRTPYLQLGLHGIFLIRRARNPIRRKNRRPTPYLQLHFSPNFLLF